jgi:hypothetical protein
LIQTTDSLFPGFRNSRIVPLADGVARVDSKVVLPKIPLNRWKRRSAGHGGSPPTLAPVSWGALVSEFKELKNPLIVQKAVLEQRLAKAERRSQTD